jgi:hypothetical protein
LPRGRREASRPTALRASRRSDDGVRRGSAHPGSHHLSATIDGVSVPDIKGRYFEESVLFEARRGARAPGAVRVAGTGHNARVRRGSARRRPRRLASRTSRAVRGCRDRRAPWGSRVTRPPGGPTRARRGVWCGGTDAGPGAPCRERGGARVSLEALTAGRAPPSPRAPRAHPAPKPRSGPGVAKPRAGTTTPRTRGRL